MIGGLDFLEEHGTMFDFLGQLNESQYKAVVHDGGPLLILAGAGSGKTRVITYRIAYLISQGIFWPEEILAVTFTNKAAVEMKGRISQILENASSLPLVGTFHSTSARWLRKEGHYLGYDSNFSIYDAKDMLAIVKESMKKLKIRSEEHTSELQSH